MFTLFFPASRHAGCRAPRGLLRWVFVINSYLGSKIDMKTLAPPRSPPTLRNHPRPCALLPIFK